MKFRSSKFGSRISNKVFFIASFLIILSCQKIIDEYFLLMKTISENYYSPEGQLKYAVERSTVYKLFGSEVASKRATVTYFKYDKYGNCIEELFYDFPRNSKSQPKSQVLRAFIGKNMVSEQRVISIGGYLMINKDSFNLDHTRVMTTNFNFAPPAPDTSVRYYGYSSQGDVKKCLVYSNGNLISTDFDRFEKGKKISSVSVDRYGDTFAITHFRHLDTLTLEAYYPLDNSSIDSTWRCGDKMYKQVLYYPNTKSASRINWKYDYHGNCIEMIQEWRQ